MTFLIELIVDRDMDSSEFLQTSHSPEPQHPSLPSSKRKVAVPGPVIDPATSGFEAAVNPKLMHSRAVEERSLSVTIDRGSPCLRSGFLNSFNAALRSRVFVTMAYNTSPS